MFIFHTIYHSIIKKKEKEKLVTKNQREVNKERFNHYLNDKQKEQITKDALYLQLKDYFRRRKCS
jgi:hypothetical protein